MNIYYIDFIPLTATKGKIKMNRMEFLYFATWLYVCEIVCEIVLMVIRVITSYSVLLNNLYSLLKIKLVVSNYLGLRLWHTCVVILRIMSAVSQDNFKLVI